jgi:hypothetical protein
MDIIKLKGHKLAEFSTLDVSVLAYAMQLHLKEVKLKAEMLF